MKNGSDTFDVVFIDFYDKNYRFLLKYLFFLVNDICIAEDLVHDIFVRLYSSKNDNIANPKIKNYIKKAARNIVIDHLKRLSRDEAKRRRMIPVLEELSETIYASLEDSVIDGYVISTVHDILEEFSDKNKKIFISRMLEQKTRKQVSEEEDVSRYAVKRIEDEILKILRKKLKQYL